MRIKRNLEQLKIKDEGDLAESDADAIHAIKSQFLENPTLATAIFDEPVLRKLGDQFESTFKRVEQKINSLLDEVFQVTEEVTDEIKEEIYNGELKERLVKALESLQTGFLDTLDKSRASVATLEKEKTRLEEENDRVKNGNAQSLERIERLTNEMTGLHELKSGLDEWKTQQTMRMTDLEVANAKMLSERDQLSADLSQAKA